MYQYLLFVVENDWSLIYYLFSKIWTNIIVSKRSTHLFNYFLKVNLRFLQYLKLVIFILQTDG